MTEQTAGASGNATPATKPAAAPAKPAPAEPAKAKRGNPLEGGGKLHKQEAQQEAK